jgi:hypothetical protein
MNKPGSSPKRVTVQISKEHHKLLKLEAARRDTTIYGLLDEILDQKFARTKGHGAADKTAHMSCEFNPCEHGYADAGDCPICYETGMTEIREERACKGIEVEKERTK